MKCGEYLVENPNHDYCYDCWIELEEEEEDYTAEDSFEKNLGNIIYTVYVMFYGNKEKIGYTKDLNSRVIEIRREFPNNKLVYFREFTKQSEARRFEAWLKDLTKRELMRFVSTFQDKVQKVERI